MRKMREYNFKASDSTGEMLMGLGFAFSFMGVAGIILTLRLILFPKIKYSSYVDNIYLEKFLIVVPALIITAYIMKLIKKYAIKNYHIYEDKEILKIENDKMLKRILLPVFLFILIVFVVVETLKISVLIQNKVSKEMISTSVERNMFFK